MTSNNAAPKQYIYGTARTLMFRPGRTMVSTFEGKIVWVEVLKNEAEALKEIERQKEIHAIGRRRLQADYDAAGIMDSTVLDRDAQWDYRMATEADAQDKK